MDDENGKTFVALCHFSHVLVEQVSWVKLTLPAISNGFYYDID
jgi:hypothetical protein